MFEASYLEFVTFEMGRPRDGKDLGVMEYDFGLRTSLGRRIAQEWKNLQDGGM